MIAAVSDALQRYADFSGRTSRAGYWWFAVFYMIAIFVATFVDEFMGTTWIANAVVFALIIPSISVAARRMHDVGKSGWYQLVPIYNLYLTLQPSRPEHQG